MKDRPYYEWNEKDYSKFNQHRIYDDKMFDEKHKYDFYNSKGLRGGKNIVSESDPNSNLNCRNDYYEYDGYSNANDMPYYHKEDKEYDYYNDYERKKYITRDNEDFNDQTYNKTKGGWGKNYYKYLNHQRDDYLDLQQPYY